MTTPVARHEAAHALVARLVRHEVVLVALDDDNGGTCQMAGAPPETRDAIERGDPVALRWAMERLLVVLAGDAALDGPDPDLAMPYELESPAPEWDDGRLGFEIAWDLAGPDVRGLLERAHALAVGIVRAHAGAIDAVAAALDRDRQLDGETVEKLVEEGPDMDNMDNDYLGVGDWIDAEEARRRRISASDPWAGFEAVLNGADDDAATEADPEIAAVMQRRSRFERAVHEEGSPGPERTHELWVAAERSAPQHVATRRGEPSGEVRISSEAIALRHDGGPRQ